MGYRRKHFGGCCADSLVDLGPLWSTRWKKTKKRSVRILFLRWIRLFSFRTGLVITVIHDFNVAGQICPNFSFLTCHPQPKTVDTILEICQSLLAVPPKVALDCLLRTSCSCQMQMSCLSPYRKTDPPFFFFWTDHP